jgi:hypothetical protein
MTDKVFHFTSTEYLPLILASRKLVPNRDVFVAADANGCRAIFPSTVLLWATTKARGDRSVPSIVRHYMEDEWEWFDIRLVRFTLHASDFEPWSKIITRCPEWSPEQIKHVKKYPTPRAWRCRSEPLPWERWIAIEIKIKYGRWWPYDFRKHVPHISEKDAAEIVAALQAYPRVLPGQNRMFAELSFPDPEARDQGAADLAALGFKVEQVDDDVVKVRGTYDGDSDEFYQEMCDVVGPYGDVLDSGYLDSPMFE